MQITIEFDENALTSYSDGFLATLWHVAQANPAELGDRKAGEVVKDLTREIVRRWLGTVPAELYKHQTTHYYWDQLRQFAKYVPGGPAGSAEWHDGEWVLRDDAPGVAAASNGVGPEQSGPAS